ncbi:MAG: NfeD family protein [Cyanobacteria bacterium HKST-UBA04]|nr:NfeD family protein [Cyanobacteria bacterium HKST-UBA05]MCA9799082.1 NfeD family protein [Cyanobacteria bacterium HKST-UBA04]MCA9842128.1 NfeD family protein [Cyanobacteria bacterium HKST-UBA03]
MNRHLEHVLDWIRQELFGLGWSLTDRLVVLIIVFLLGFLLLAPSPFAAAAPCAGAASLSTDVGAGVLLSGSLLGTLVLVLLMAVVVGVGIYLVVLAQQQRVVSPAEKVLGEQGKVVQTIAGNGIGKVFVFGETWDAVLDDSGQEPLEVGTFVRVVALDRALQTCVRVKRLDR